MKKGLELLAEVAKKAAKRANGKASEYGLYQPKKPVKREK